MKPSENPYLVCVCPPDVQLTEATFEKVHAEWRRRRAAGDGEPLSEADVRSIVGSVSPEHQESSPCPE